MKKATLIFNENTLVYYFKFNAPEFSIRVTNIYVHLPYEGSLNKQSIAWALELKPALKYTFNDGTETYTRRMDISMLEKIFDGRPILRESSIDTDRVQISEEKMELNTCSIELDYDKQYPAPEISVDFELSQDVALIEELVV